MPVIKNFHRKHHQEALRMLWREHSYEEVAEKFGVKRDTIYRLAKNHGADGLASGKKVRHPMLGCRITHEEMEAFEALVAQHGYHSKSQLMRALIRGSVGMLEMPSEQAETIHRMRNDVSRAATNINQIARAANQGKFAMTSDQMNQLSEFNRDVRKARAYLGDVVADARRRTVRLWRKSEFGPESGDKGSSGRQQGE